MRLLTSILALALSSAFASTALASGDQEPSIEDRLELCVTCHGENGASEIPLYPILAGQEFYYLYVQLKDFKAGRRTGPEMEPIVADMSRDEMKALATYFSEQEWPRTSYVADAKLAAKGLTASGAGQCVQCHLGGFEGNSRVPRLAGQHHDYLEKTLFDFKHKVRMNSPAKSSLMASFDDADIIALAAFLADK